jgi:hypothetical protein
MLQAYVSNVLSEANVHCRKCFSCHKCFMSRHRRSPQEKAVPMCASDVTKVDLDVAYVATAIHVCCKYLFRMFHLLRTYVASAFIWSCICCSGYIHTLQTYVPNISSAFRHMLQKMLSCCKCFVSKRRRSRMYMRFIFIRGP